jgi:peroxiredoxin Q/BCP
MGGTLPQLKEIAMPMPNVGDAAPDFTLDGDTGPIRLADFAGKKLVLYFYPKDDTPGCTTEGKDFSSLKADFDAADTVVVGVSRDSVASHAKFRAKHGLNVGLGADEGAVTDAYGVWVEKSMYGKKYMGIERATFLIDRAGKVAGVWPKVKVPGHAAAVLAAAQALG